MFLVQKMFFVYLQCKTAVPGKKSPQGRGTNHMEIQGMYYTIKGDKRKRTLTIRSFIEGKLQAKYRTIPQTPHDFDYYTSTATQNDIRQLLKTNDYYVVR